jgi:hypothetical protein
MYGIRVYVDDHCIGCKRAQELVERAHQLRPDVDIRAIAVDDTTELPESLFALPTWYIDDGIWMMGNPSWEELKAILLAEATTSADSPDS